MNWKGLSVFVVGMCGLPLGTMAAITPMFYVAGYEADRINAVAANGTVSPFFTGGHPLSSGPSDVVLDRQGNILMTYNPLGQIRRITPDGAVSTFASGLNIPMSLALDAAGTLYCSDEGTNSIRKIASDGTVSTFVASISNPQGLAFDAAGNLYSANNGSRTISRITPGGVVSTLAVLPSGPHGLAFDGAGMLYATAGDSIYRITPGGVVSTFVSGLPSPIGLRFDGGHDFWVANYGDGSVMKVATDGTITTYATGLSHADAVLVVPEPGMIGAGAGIVGMLGTGRWSRRRSGRSAC